MVGAGVLRSGRGGSTRLTSLFVARLAPTSVMNMPSKKLIPLIERAAQLRAIGQTWDQIARKMHRSGDDIRRWPKRFPEFWETVISESRREAVCEARDEGVTALRTLARSKNEKVKCSASTKLAGLPKDGEKPTATPEELVKFIQFLEGLDDEELESFMREDEAQEQTVPPSGDPDAADPPSAA